VGWRHLSGIVGLRVVQGGCTRHEGRRELFLGYLAQGRVFRQFLVETLGVILVIGGHVQQLLVDSTLDFVNARFKHFIGKVLGAPKHRCIGIIPVSSK
jgi:hypothetical protein